jgi:hypothetical protein
MRQIITVPRRLRFKPPPSLDRNCSSLRSPLPRQLDPHSRRRRQRLQPSHAAVQPPPDSPPHTAAAPTARKNTTHTGAGAETDHHGTTSSSGCLRPRHPSVLDFPPSSRLPASRTGSCTWLDSSSLSSMRRRRSSSGRRRHRRCGGRWWGGSASLFRFCFRSFGHAVLRPALSFVGVRYPLLSGPAASNPSSEVAFMPLRSEVPADAAPAPTPAPEPVGRLTVRSFNFFIIRLSF